MMGGSPGLASARAPPSARTHGTHGMHGMDADAPRPT